GTATRPVPLNRPAPRQRPSRPALRCMSCVLWAAALGVNMSNQYTRPLASFWVALVLASAYMVPIIAALAKVPAALSGPGFLAIIFPPLLLAEPLAVVLIVVFVYLRKKFAIIAMMVGIPLAVPSFLAGIDQIVFHEDHVGAN